MRREPIILLSLVEHELQEADADNDQADADVIHAVLRSPEVFEIGRILDNALCQHQREDADGHVDEEDPVPAVVIRDPTAKSWTDCRSDDDGYAIHGECHAALLGRKRVSEDCLFAGPESATACTLQDAEEDQHG